MSENRRKRRLKEKSKVQQADKNLKLLKKAVISSWLLGRLVEIIDVAKYYYTA